MVVTISTLRPFLLCSAAIFASVLHAQTNLTVALDGTGEFLKTVRARVQDALAGHAPVGDLSPYERTEDRDDYRHRMITNGAAFLVCVLLVMAGVWIADTMAEMRRDQDCVLSGRRVCTPIVVPTRSRW